MIEIDSYQKRCKDTIGGVKEFYLAPYEKWTKSQISVLDMDLVSIPETDFYLFECIGTYNQDSSLENGAVYFNQSIELKLPKVYDTVNALKFTKQLYRVILKTNNNQYIIFGTYNGLEAKLSNTSGNSKAEFNGFSLSFTGKEKDTGYLIRDLADSNITIIDNSFFNYDLNLDF